MVSRGVKMEREKILPWGWLKRTEELIPGEHKQYLNECLGAIIVVTSIHETGDLEGVILPGNPHDANVWGGHTVKISKEWLCDNRFFMIVASPLRSCLIFKQPQFVHCNNVVVR